MSGLGIGLSQNNDVSTDEVEIIPPHPLSVVSDVVVAYIMAEGLDPTILYADYIREGSGAGNGTLATGSNAPTWNTSPNRLTFDGTDWVVIPNVAITNLHAFVLAKTSGLGGNRSLFANAISGGAPQFRLNSSPSRMSLLSSGVAGIGTANTNISSGITFKGEVSYVSAGAWNFYLNHVADGNGTSTQVFTRVINRIGASGVVEGFVGDILAMVLCDAVLVGEDLTIVRNWIDGI